jgi:hypothetical protein
MPCHYKLEEYLDLHQGRRHCGRRNHRLYDRRNIGIGVGEVERIVF